MIQNTSETRETLGRYTIPQLEAMVEALNQNNSTDDTKSKKTLEGKEAIDFFLNGGKL